VVVVLLGVCLHHHMETIIVVIVIAITIVIVDEVGIEGQLQPPPPHVICFILCLLRLLPFR
jgi:hypothetical protein